MAMRARRRDLITDMDAQPKRPVPLDLSRFATTPPERSLHLLFIHHSCGGQLLAAPGRDIGTNAIYTTHPNGGDLRARLVRNSYIIHEASYGSRIGQHTDIFDWLPKFRNEMDHILSCDLQDRRLKDGCRNEIVVFKSCFPNNAFLSEGTPPGNARGPGLTLWNAKATYLELIDEFRKHPEVLFVCFTAPPLAPRTQPKALLKRWLNTLGGGSYSLGKSGQCAREFNNWLSGENGWLMNSNLSNVAVFDYYDILTGSGASDLSCFPTGDGYDSHPSREGNMSAAGAFVPFLNRAIRRAGLGS